MPPPKRKREKTSLFAPPGQGLYLPVTMRTGERPPISPALTGPYQQPATVPAYPAMGYPAPLQSVAQPAYPAYTYPTQPAGFTAPTTFYPSPLYRVGRETRTAGYQASAPTVAPAATPPPAGGAGTTGKAGASAGPPGVSQWYQEFTKEHGGKTPEQFYGSEQYGLAQALADREWSQGFAQMYGRSPSDDDWNAWYYQKTGTRWQTMGKAEREAEKKENRQFGRNEWAYEKGWRGKGGGFFGSWNAYEKAVQEGRVKPGQGPEEAGEPGSATEEQRPPTYRPPQIYWR